LLLAINSLFFDKLVAKEALTRLQVRESVVRRILLHIHCKSCRVSVRAHERA